MTGWAGFYVGGTRLRGRFATGTNIVRSASEVTTRVSSRVPLMKLLPSSYHFLSFGNCWSLVRNSLPCENRQTRSNLFVLHMLPVLNN